MMDKTYQINEIFFSLQGEGIRAGTANVFVRFSACNQTCKVETHGFDCDTEFRSGRKLTLDEILTEIRNLTPDVKWLILTGGEPGLQVDAAFMEYFHSEGYKMAMETNGSIDVSALGLDWVTVSPKVAEHCIRQLTAHEVKYVRAHGQGIPRTAVKAEHHLVSPAFDGPGLDPIHLAWCITLCKTNPDWRLSVQQHKLWRVR